MQQAVDDFERVKSLWPQVQALSYLELKVLSDAIMGPVPALVGIREWRYLRLEPSSQTGG